MATIKVADVGDEWIAKIAKAEAVEGNFGPQAMFVDENNDVLYMPLESAERQLERLELTIGDIQQSIEEGAVCWLKFYRQPNTRAGAKPFWAISRVGQRTATKPATATRTPPVTDRASQSPPAASTAKAEPAKVQVPLFEVYRAILAAVGEEFFQDSWTPADLLACVATIYIQACKEPNRPVFAAKARSQARRNEPPPPTDADKPEDDHLRGGDDEYGF